MVILAFYHTFLKHFIPLIYGHLICDNCSTRVSNELGAGRPQGARLAVSVMVIIAILEGILVAIITILVRRVWGKLYSNEQEVIQYVAQMMPLLALSDFLDGFQCVLSGSNFLSWSYLLIFICDSEKILDF